MVGYGENGSVVGPQNLPTSSVASGVWSLGEVAEAQRDGIWPNPPTTVMEVISEGVLTSTATNIQIASIPDIYTNLELIWTGRTTSTSGPSTVRFTVNNDTADNYGSGYGYRQVSSSMSDAQGRSQNLYNSDARFRAGYAATDGTGSPTGYMAMSRIYIYNYSQTTHGKNMTYISGTPGSSNRNFGFQFGGGYWSGTAAISEIDFDAWGETMYAGTTWQLNGYG